MFSGFSSANFVNIPQSFQDYFRCYPIAMMNDSIRKDDANFGGKIFLPPSALNKLTMLHIRYPMLFELKSSETGLRTHSGVLEFTAEEGRCYMPQWMMQTLGVQPGALITVTSNSDIPLGNFVKIEPQSTDFLDISDPKAVLENVLRNFSTLTVGDIAEFEYNKRNFKIKVLEVKPESHCESICVIETDLVTDFAPPVGYVEPDYKAMQQEQKKPTARINPAAQGLGSMSQRINYSNIVSAATTSFGGDGQKLSGKTIKKQPTVVEKISLEGEPKPLILPEGQLFFGFPLVPVQEETQDEDKSSSVFKGEGQSLRQTKKRQNNNKLEGRPSKSPKSPEVIEID